MKCTNSMETEIDFLKFVKEFDKKGENNTEFDCYYTLIKDKHNKYYITSRGDFSIICKLPEWLNKLFFRFEKEQ